MRALRTAQPRRACDTTVFSCANRGDGVPGQWPPIIAWPVRSRSHCHTVPSRCGQLTVTSFQRSGRARRVSGRSGASSIAHLGAKVSGPHMGPHRSAGFPAPLRPVPTVPVPVHVHVHLPSRQDAQPPVPWRHTVEGADSCPVPGPTSVHETGATTRVPWTLAGRRVPSAVHGGPRRFVPLRSGACARRSGD